LFSDLTLQLAIEICRSEESSKSFPNDYCRTRTRAGGKRKGKTDHLKAKRLFHQFEQKNLNQILVSILGFKQDGIIGLLRV
jgi:hypothetical protein